MPSQEINFGDWLDGVEKGISLSIAHCYPRSWSEDHITYTWLKRLTAGPKNIAFRTPYFSPFSVAWDAYKAQGDLEEGHGDIAFLVRCSFSHGDDLEGVGFLEAKRIYPSGRYDALKWNQLAYQSSHVSNHQLLLYNPTLIPDSVKNLLSLGFCNACYPRSFAKVRAVVIPTPHAIARRTRTTDLHALSTPLSYQICCRYLRGLDLDWNRDLVDAVRAGAVAGVRFLFIAHTVLGFEGTPNIQSVEIERDYYEIITPGEDLLYEE